MKLGDTNSIVRLLVGWLNLYIGRKEEDIKQRNYGKEDKEEEIRAKNTDRKRKREMMRRGNIPCGWGLVRRAGSGGDNSLNWEKKSSVTGG